MAESSRSGPRLSPPARAALRAALVAVALSLVVPALPRASAAERLQMAVRPGFAGAAKLGSWMPVAVELQNPGDEIAGELQVQVDASASRTSFNRPPVTYTAPVTLPSRARKRIAFEVLTTGTDDRVLAQFIADGQAIVKQTVSFDRISASELFCGVIAGNPAGLDFVATLDLGGRQRRPRLANLELADVPSSPYLLQSLDCLILTNVGTAGLADGQRDAIQQWVNTGGLLVLGGGSGSQKTIAPLPAALLPVKVAGSVPIPSVSQLGEFLGQPLTERGPWLVGDATVTDGVAVVEQEGVPLLVAGRRGLGSVVYLGLDPAAEPLRSWQGSPLLWRDLLGLAPGAPPGQNNLARQQIGWGRLPRTALSDLTGFSRASTDWLLYLLLGFALVVGPGNYLALRALGRLEWSLATVPLATLLAAAGALAGARANPASDLVVNNLTLVRSWDGQGAVAHTYVGVFSLREQAPDLQLAEGSLVSPLFYPFPSEPTPTAGPASGSQGAVPGGQTGVGAGSGRSPSFATPAPTPTPAPTWTLGVWRSQRSGIAGLALRPGALGSFALDQSYRLPGRIAGGLVVGQSSARGEVASRLSRPLRAAALVVGGEVVRLGNLGAGETRPVAVDLRAPALDTGEALKRLYPTEGDQPPAEEVALRDLLQAALGPAPTAGSKVDLGAAALVGWLDDPASGKPATSGRSTFLQRTLLVAAVPLRPDPGVELRVPSALVSRRSLLAGVGARQQGEALAFSSGDAVSWEYALPFDLARFDVSELRVDLAGALQRLPASTALPSLGAASFYDWQRAEWTPVELDFGENRVDRPGRFVSPLGVVRLRYSFRAPASSSSGSVTFSAFDLAISGRGR